MHRVIYLVVGGLLAVLALGPVAGCSTPSFEAQDTAEVESLRLRIAQVRNAVDETRETIAWSQGAEYLPELYMRLAELLSEEARYHYQLARLRESGEAQADLYVPEVRLLKNDAIDIYQTTLRRFPDSAEAPRMLFNMGHEHRELGNYDEMRTAMQRLVAEYPDSLLRHQALIVLGDYEFDQHEMSEAAHYYEQIIDDELNSASGLAQYKMAWVAINDGDCEQALNFFESAMGAMADWEEYLAGDEVNLAALEGLPGVDQSIDVERNSLVDLGYCYSQERQPEDAIAYYREWANNRPTYVAGLHRLARRYRLHDEFEGARDVSRELLNYGHADFDRLEDARTLFTSLNELGDYDSVASDVELINRALTNYHGQISIEESEAVGLFEEFEVYVRSLSTEAQEKMNQASGEEEQRQAAEVARAYRAHLDTYPDSEERVSILLNLVEVLEVEDRNFEAGQRGMEAATLIDDDEERADALYDAVVNFQTSLEREADRGQFESVTARTSLRAAGEQLLELGLEGDRRKRVKFAIAESHFDAGEYDEAIDKLGLVAYQFPDTDQSEEAIRLVLDSYLTITDFDGLIAASQRFLQSGSPASSSLRTDIEEILEVAEQQRLDALTLAAAGDDDVDLTPLQDFAEVHAGTETGENALLNAFVAARSSGDTAQMYEMADELAASYPDSDELSGIFSSLAQTAVRRFEYDRGVEFLERAGDYDPEQRTRFLTAAGELKQELGEYDEARRYYHEALNASETPEARAQALGSYAQLLEQSASPQQVFRELVRYEDEGQPEVLVRLGLAQLAEGNPDEAAGYFQQVLGIAGASSEAEARAHYGLAEVMLATLQRFPELEDFTVIQDYITLIDVTQQNYLNAARQRSQRYTTVAFARLAYAMQHVVGELSRVSLPADLDSQQREQLQGAIDDRIQRIEATVDEALEACSTRLWSSHIFDDVVQQCLQGQPWDATLATYASPGSRRSIELGEGAEQLRERVARNPDDVDALRTLGTQLLDGGDPHLARLAFQQAVSAGGGSEEMNLVGVASYEMGDLRRAFEAFSRSADAGNQAGKRNLGRILRENGQSDLVDELAERYSAEREGGREL